MFGYLSATHKKIKKSVRKKGKSKFDFISFSKTILNHHRTI
jgi:hypothetical protein